MKQKRRRRYHLWRNAGTHKGEPLDFTPYNPPNQTVEPVAAKTAETIGDCPLQLKRESQLKEARRKRLLNDLIDRGVIIDVERGAKRVADLERREALRLKERDEIRVYLKKRGKI
jgi:hypothetical protein